MLKIILFLIASMVSSHASQLNIAVPSIAGGGVDVQARVVARHLSKHLNVTSNVINMQGAGGLTMANWLYNIAEPNTNIAMIGANTDIIVKGILQDHNAKYQLTQFKWLFSAEDGSNNVFVLWANTGRGLRTIDDLIEENVYIIGNPGINHLQNYILRNIVGVRSKLIYGYKDIVHALNINEIDARFGTLLNARVRNPEWINGTSNIIPILQVGSVERHPLLPNVPTIREYANTEDHLSFLDFYEKNVRLARLVFASPKMSEQRVQEILKAVELLRNDRDFLDDARKVEMEGDFIDYETTNHIVSDILSFNRDFLYHISK